MRKNLVDIHCHVLPGVDDGSKSLEVSLAMVKQAVNEGVETIIATPHYIVGELEHDYAFVKEQVEALQAEVDKAGLPCRIVTGAEIYICPELTKHMHENRLITLNQTPYILVEFPGYDVNENLLEIVRDLVKHGYKPIIAHPERNEILLQNSAMIDNLAGMGCYFQVNGSSVLGRNGTKSQKMVLDLVKKGLVHFLASDAHSATNRKITLAEPLKMLDSLVRGEVSSCLVANGENVVFNRKIEQIDINALQKNRGVLGRLREVFSK